MGLFQGETITMFDFKGKKALITGATRGIGKAVASAFLNHDATVFGVYASDNRAADSFLDECGEKAANLHLFQCDVADPEQVGTLYAKIESQFDTIDILVNNAGIRRDGVVAMMQQDDWQRVIDVNLTGTFNMSKQAVLLMLKQKYGRIINITSPMAYLGFAGQANYAASKAGQIGMMRALSKEVAKRKITVNCVSPGFVDTELLGDLTDEQFRNYKKMIPMNRFGRPEEIADGVLFLASDKAGYINGAVLEINGGL
jgi:3-oxoacyl-[acyl-carrier protein] reductase